MKITKARLAEITKEIVQEEKEEYEKFFRAMLKKHGVSSPTELSDEEKKDFFNQVDAEYKAKHEGNAFGAAVTAAKEKGEDEFEVGGKTYQVESTDSINERYIRSRGFKETADRIERLSITLDPNSILAKNISKNADNVMPEFKKMKKYMDEIYTIWQEIEYTIEMQNESVKESASCSCGCGTCSESVNEGFYKNIMSDGGRNLFFAMVDDKTDEVKTVDAKTWLSSSLMDNASKHSKERIVKAILRNQKQFNKKVEFNMWAKKNRPNFKETMEYFFKNGFINNITNKGIKVYESKEEAVFEGRAFVQAARKAKEEGKTEFEFNGKTYPITLKD